MKKYWTVAAMNWQESLTYRFNAFIWVLYAVLPSLTLMLVWRAKYASSGGAPSPGGLTLPQMMTYYFFITALSVVITPHPEWDIAMQIRDGKITSFIVRPIGFYGYRLFQETAYQVLKSLMLLPALGVMLWIFHDDLRWPPFDASRFGLFLLSTLLAYGLLTQIKNPRRERRGILRECNFLCQGAAFWGCEVKRASIGHDERVEAQEEQHKVADRFCPVPALFPDPERSWRWFAHRSAARPSKQNSRPTKTRRPTVASSPAGTV